MKTTPLSFHISPQWKQNNTNSSVNKQQEFLFNHLRKSKNLDLCRSRSFLELHMDHDETIDCSDLHMKNSVRRITVNFNTTSDYNPDVKTASNLNQIQKDIQTYRNQLHHAHGSIHIQACSSGSERCSCHNHRSSDICKQISTFEKELWQKDSVEYIFPIESSAKKDTTIYQ